MVFSECCGDCGLPARECWYECDWSDEACPQHDEPITNSGGGDGSYKAHEVCVIDLNGSSVVQGDTGTGEDERAAISAREEKRRAESIAFFNAARAYRLAGRE